MVDPVSATVLMAVLVAIPIIILIVALSIFFSSRKKHLAQNNRLNEDHYESDDVYSNNNRNSYRYNSQGNYQPVYQPNNVGTPVSEEPFKIDGVNTDLFSEGFALNTNQ